MPKPSTAAPKPARTAAARSKRAAPAKKAAPARKATPKPAPKPKAVAHRLPRKPRVAPAQDKLAEYGLDAILEDVTGGESLTGIAKKVGVNIAVLLHWIDADPKRSARVTKARALTARLWDEKAEQGIAAAKNKLGLSKARELAHHYRWRASKIAPKEYGAHVDIKLEGNLRHASDTDLDALANQALKEIATATGQSLAEVTAQMAAALGTKGDAPAP